MTSKHSGWRGRRWCWSVQQTTRQRVPQCTIAGDRAEQSPTKGAVCRPSRHRLSDEVFPATHEIGNTRHGGVHDHAESETTELWRQRPLHTQRVKERGERVVLGDTGPRTANTWVSTWTGEQLVVTTQALDEPRHHTAEDGGYGARGARLTH